MVEMAAKKSHTVRSWKNQISKSEQVSHRKQSAFEWVLAKRVSSNSVVAVVTATEIVTGTEIEITMVTFIVDHLLDTIPTLSLLWEMIQDMVLPRKRPCRPWVFLHRCLVSTFRHHHKEVLACFRKECRLFQ